MKVILLLLVISSIAFAQPPSADYVYDSSSSSTFTLSTGNTITRWDDPIGFSHFLGCTSTATYLSSGGIKGASSVQCSSTCLKTNQFILEPPYYTAAVVQASGAGNIISQTAGTMSHRMFDIVIDSSYNVDVWVGDTKITSSPVSVGVYGFLVSVDVDDSNNSATARINGTSVGTATANTYAEGSSLLTIGGVNGSPNWSGELAYFAIWASYVDPTDVASIESTLMSTWL